MDSLIKTKAAVAFLQDPKLKLNGLQEKLEFLKYKGLNQEEIDEAINMAITRKDARSGWNFFLVLGLFVGGFKLYQYFQQAKDKSQEKDNEKPKEKNVFATIDEILDQVNKLRQQVESSRNSTTNEIKSLKTLLLGHEKFASPPAIPAWQMDKDVNDGGSK